MTGAEVRVRRLFVGGPWHGQVHEIPDIRDLWLPDASYAARYHLITYAIGYRRAVRIFVQNPINRPFLAEVLEALALGAGLEILEDK